MPRHLMVLAVLLGMLVASGCGPRTKVPKGLQRLPTNPVSGTIHVDGKPEINVKIMLFPKDKLPQFLELQHGAPHSGLTDAEGKFKITTYETGDGAPEGQYVMAFYWEKQTKAVPFGNPDEPKVDPIAQAFNKKYFQPTLQSPPVEIKKGPNDLGTIELTTKK